MSWTEGTKVDVTNLAELPYTLQLETQGFTHVHVETKIITFAGCEVNQALHLKRSCKNLQSSGLKLRSTDLLSIFWNEENVLLPFQSFYKNHPKIDKEIWEYF